MSKSRHTIAHILPWPSVGGVELATLRIAHTTGSQCREDIFELQLSVIGVQVFHKLIAVGEVDATRRNGNGNSIRNDQLERLRRI